MESWKEIWEVLSTFFEQSIEVSVRRVEDMTEALWSSKDSPATISELKKKAYVHIEDWRNRSLKGGKNP